MFELATGGEGLLPPLLLFLAESFLLPLLLLLLTVSLLAVTVVVEAAAVEDIRWDSKFSFCTKYTLEVPLLRPSEGLRITCGVCSPPTAGSAAVVKLELKNNVKQNIYMKNFFVATFSLFPHVLHSKGHHQKRFSTNIAEQFVLIMIRIGGTILFSLMSW